MKKVYYIVPVFIFVAMSLIMRAHGKRHEGKADNVIEQNITPKNYIQKHKRI